MLVSVWSTSASQKSRTGFSIARPFHFGMSNSGRTSMSNSKVSGPSSGNSTASKSKSGSLMAESFCSSFTWARLFINNSPLTFSPISLRKRVSTSFRGARPGRNPGTWAVGINSENSLSKYRSMSSRGTVTVT